MTQIYTLVVLWISAQSSVAHNLVVRDLSAETCRQMVQTLVDNTRDRPPRYAGCVPQVVPARD